MKKLLVIAVALSLAFGIVLVNGNETKAKEERVIIQAAPGGGGGGGDYPST